MPNKDSFYGGVIYIDLRGYTKIVEEKYLENIAEIIYSYQQAVTEKVYTLFEKNEVSGIEYMGDGILIILKKNVNCEQSLLANKLYENTKLLSETVSIVLKKKKEKFSGLDNIDYGIGISTSIIHQQYIDMTGQKKRNIFFGVSLNRAAKIGDSMNINKNHIGIDKRMYDDFLYGVMPENEKQMMTQKDNPIVHMHQTTLEKSDSDIFNINSIYDY